MSIRTILINLNETANNAAMMATGAMLAREFDARVRGLYVVPATRIYPDAYYEPIPEMFEAHRRYFDQQIQPVKAAFDAVFRGSTLRGELRVENSPSPLIADCVTEMARVCDFAVVSQTKTSARLGVELDFVPRVAIAAGRPVIVVPFDSALESVPETVVIGWNGSRESARAAFDSLPFLRRAKAVHIVQVDPPGECSGARSLPENELGHVLGLHGIRAVTSSLMTTGENTGQAILRRAGELGAGLLVIGAYGHSRLSELILGGVTHTVLRTMSCPVLLSH